MILSCLRSHKVSSSEVREFEDLLAAQKEYFAEEEVTAAFPRLVSFVKQTEQMMNDLTLAEAAARRRGLILFLAS